jgi:glutamyl-tRNA synthetase
VLRVEDLDPPRVVPGATERILDDLRWLGLDWYEGPYFQSQRSELYNQAIDSLDTYPCTCSRAEIVASAPHLGEEGPRYPGTCRDPRNRKPGRPAAIRLRVPDRVVTFEDEIHGHVEQNVFEAVGDFVLRRADGVASYQLAVVVDDLAMRIEEVVRGDDLLLSTARQQLLIELLGGTPPRWVHLPLVLGPDGSRLAKRHQASFRGSTIPELRAMGVSQQEILGALGAALGLIPEAQPLPLSALVDAAERQIPRRFTPWSVPPQWVTARRS